MLKRQFKAKKVGLALGGGAAKGAAHIGVLRAFEEKEITIDAMAATSVGAIIGAFYAFGLSVDKISEIAKGMSLSHVSGFTLKKKGFSTTERLQALIEEHLGQVDLADAQIPLAIVATNIRTGKKAVFTQGNLAKIVAASAAIPGLFIPVEIDGEEYVDGGLSENVPVSALKQFGVMASVAVDLDGGDSYPVPESFLDVLTNSLDIAINSKTLMQLKKADIVVCLNLRSFSRTDNREQTEELIRIAYDASMQSLEKLRWHTSSWLIKLGLRLSRNIAGR